MQNLLSFWGWGEVIWTDGGALVGPLGRSLVYQREYCQRSMRLCFRADCTEACKQRRREMEAQAKQLRRDLQQREEQLTQLENELRILRQFKEQHNTDILMSALSAMQEKNMHLESSLSAETRVKLDLFSALGEAKRQLEIAQSKCYGFGVFMGHKGAE